MPVPTEVSPRASHSHSHSHSAHSLGPIVTHDLQRGSPTPKFEVEKPRRRSLSPMPSSAPSSSKVMYTPPPLTWRTAFQDAKAGIHYTKDSFPSSTFLPPPFSREPVKVEAAERVEILEEMDDYAVRVRVLRTGDVGLIPLWNTEGALERLTRINTAFNEAATCPLEARALRRRDSESSATSWDDGHSPTDASLSHVHARCIPFATRVRFPDYYGASSPFSDCDDDSDSDSSLHSPREPYERGRTPFPAHHVHSQPKVYEAQPRTLEQGGISETSARSHSGGRQKSVNFVEGERPQVVFRYPSEELVGAFLGEKTGGGAEARVEEEEEEEEEGEWWWHGWEEMREELEEETGGRGRETRESARPSVGGPSGVAQMLSSVDEEERFPSVFYEDDDL